MNAEPESIVEKHSEKIHQGLQLLPSLKYGIPGVFGNKRWTPELIFATYAQATSGNPPQGLEYKIGASGGGFDRLDFKTQRSEPSAEARECDLSIDLNLRHTGPRIKIPIPIYGAGMSFGSISLNFMLARALAAKQLNTFTSTGEGGYPPPLLEYKDHVITQIATGMFGVREDTIQAARIVEFKYCARCQAGFGRALAGG